MPRRALIAVRVVGFLFLAFALLAFFGSGRSDDVADKAALYLSVFLIQFPLVIWLGRRDKPASPLRQKIIWSVVGLVAGLIGGYLLWNASLYVRIELIRGGGTNQAGMLRTVYRDRFDWRASWGTLLLAVSLALLIALTALGRRQKSEGAAPADNKETGRSDEASK